jgi:hypothetical protein
MISDTTSTEIAKSISLWSIKSIGAAKCKVLIITPTKGRNEVKFYNDLL